MKEFAIVSVCVWRFVAVTTINSSISRLPKVTGALRGGSI